MAYYEILFGSGFYWMERYVIKTDYPTTDYGSLIDCLIDYLKEKGHRNIITMEECQGCYQDPDNGYEYIIDADGNQFYSDMYFQGGNCGDFLLHFGNSDIREISENEIGDAEVVEEVW